MAQNKTITTEETTFSTSTNFSSTLDETQHKDVLSYLNKKLGKADLDKDNCQTWLVQNKKNELFEIRFYSDEIKISFKSKVINSHSEKEIEGLIEDISTIIK